MAVHDLFRRGPAIERANHEIQRHPGPPDTVHTMRVYPEGNGFADFGNVHISIVAQLKNLFSGRFRAVEIPYGEAVGFGIELEVVAGLA